MFVGTKIGIRVTTPPPPEPAVERARPPVDTPPRPRLPPVVRWLDLATWLCLFVAIAVPLFGPTRLRFGDVLLSVASPWRALVVALVLAGLRHAYVRRPHLLERAGETWRRSRADSAVREALAAAAAIRLPVVAAAFFAVAIIGYPPERNAPFRASPNEFLNLPARWDAGWYLGIAIDGYWYEPRAKGQQNIAFFPAFPMLMRTGAALIGAYQPPPVGGGNAVEVQRRIDERTAIAGSLISLFASVWALVYLFRFARDTLGERAASGSVWLISAYPFAYFFGTLYTEGLFLLAAVATMYHFRRHEYLPAVAWGLLVGLTRPNGCFLSVPLGIMALQQSLLPSTLRAGDPAPRPGWASFAKTVAVAAMPGLGMVAFSAWLWTLTSLPLAWMQAHEAWGRTFQGIDTLVVDHAKVLFGSGLYYYAFHKPLDALYVPAVLGFLAAAWPVGRRLGLGYAVLIVITLLPPLFAGGMLSMGRVTSTLFPVFVYLAWRLPAPATLRVALGCMALQGMLAAAFFTWREVF